MSLHRRAARRDSNEAEIVAALLAAGASVTYLSGVDGLPDLLAGFQGRTYLLEVKHLTPTGKTLRQTSGGKRPDERGLTEDQQDWWAAWKGGEPVIVRTPAEALAAIGVESCTRCLIPFAPDDAKVWPTSGDGPMHWTCETPEERDADRRRAMGIR